MLFYTGDTFPAWKGQPLMVGLASQAIVDVAIEGDKAREVARYEFDQRLRAIAQGPDGALWIAEDGKDAKLLKLTGR